MGSDVSVLETASNECYMINALTKCLTNRIIKTTYTSRGCSKALEIKLSMMAVSGSFANIIINHERYSAT